MFCDHFLMSLAKKNVFVATPLRVSSKYLKNILPSPSLHLSSLISSHTHWTTTGTPTNTYTHFPHLSFGCFFSSLPPPLYPLSLNSPLPLHLPVFSPPSSSPPPPNQPGPSLVSMVTVREVLLRVENCSWLPFRSVAAEALFSPLLWMVWGSGRGERRTGGTHLFPFFFFGGWVGGRGGSTDTLCVCSLWREEEEK